MLSFLLVQTLCLTHTQTRGCFHIILKIKSIVCRMQQIESKSMLKYLFENFRDIHAD